MTDHLEIRRPDDFHVHLRSGVMLERVLPATARHFARALAMPNLTPPVVDAAGVEAYRHRIRVAARRAGFPEFSPLMTVYLTPATTPEVVHAARGAGAVAGKLYPQGVTTNSYGGVSDLEAMYPTFEAMQDVGMVLCVHAETPGEYCLDRENHFVIYHLRPILAAFPKLRVVLEHATTQSACSEVLAHENLAATITAHHLLLTLDDVVGDKLRPHLFCKPLAKRPEDRDALVAAATSGHPRYFFGSDSAPHPVSGKECESGCAGVYSAPVALATLAEVFDRAGAILLLEAFTSVNGAEFYGLPINEGRLSLTKFPTPVRLQADHSRSEVRNLGLPREEWSREFPRPWRLGQVLPWTVR